MLFSSIACETSNPFSTSTTPICGGSSTIPDRNLHTGFCVHVVNFRQRNFAGFNCFFQLWTKKSAIGCS